jgi:hypothetical protein
MEAVEIRVQTSKNQQSNNKAQQLHATAYKTCEQQRVHGRSEDVAVDKFPSTFFFFVLIL